MAEVKINPQTGRPFSPEEIKMLREIAFRESGGGDPAYGHLQGNLRPRQPTNIEVPRSDRAVMERDIDSSGKAAEQVRRDKRFLLGDPEGPDDTYTRRQLTPWPTGGDTAGLLGLGRQESKKRLDEYVKEPLTEDIPLEKQRLRGLRKQHQKPTYEGGSGYAPGQDNLVPQIFDPKGDFHEGMSQFDRAFIKPLEVAIGGAASGYMILTGDRASAGKLWEQVNAASEEVRQAWNPEWINNPNYREELKRDVLRNLQEEQMAGASDAERALFETAKIVGPLYAAFSIPLGSTRVAGATDINAALRGLLKEVGQSRVSTTVLNSPKFKAFLKTSTDEAKAFHADEVGKIDWTGFFRNKYRKTFGERMSEFLGMEGAQITGAAKATQRAVDKGPNILGMKRGYAKYNDIMKDLMGQGMSEKQALTALDKPWLNALQRWKDMGSVPRKRPSVDLLPSKVWKVGRQQKIKGTTPGTKETVVGGRKNVRETVGATDPRQKVVVRPGERPPDIQATVERGPGGQTTIEPVGGGTATTGTKFDFDVSKMAQAQKPPVVKKPSALDPSKMAQSQKPPVVNVGKTTTAGAGKPTKPTAARAAAQQRSADNQLIEKLEKHGGLSAVGRRPDGGSGLFEPEEISRIKAIIKRERAPGPTKEAARRREGKPSVTKEGNLIGQRSGRHRTPAGGKDPTPLTSAELKELSEGIPAHKKKAGEIGPEVHLDRQGNPRVVQVRKGAPAKTGKQPTKPPKKETHPTVEERLDDAYEEARRSVREDHDVGELNPEQFNAEVQKRVEKTSLWQMMDDATAKPTKTGTPTKAAKQEAELTSGESRRIEESLDEPITMNPRPDAKRKRLTAKARREKTAGHGTSPAKPVKQKETGLDPEPPSLSDKIELYRNEGLGEIKDVTPEVTKDLEKLAKSGKKAEEGSLAQEAGKVAEKKFDSIKTLQKNIEWEGDIATLQTRGSAGAKTKKASAGAKTKKAKKADEPTIAEQTGAEPLPQAAESPKLTESMAATGEIKDWKGVNAETRNQMVKRHGPAPKGGWKFGEHKAEFRKLRSEIAAKNKIKDPTQPDIPGASVGGDAEVEAIIKNFGGKRPTESQVLEALEKGDFSTLKEAHPMFRAMDYKYAQNAEFMDKVHAWQQRTFPDAHAKGTLASKGRTQHSPDPYIDRKTGKQKVRPASKVGKVTGTQAVEGGRGVGGETKMLKADWKAAARKKGMSVKESNRLTSKELQAFVEEAPEAGKALKKNVTDSPSGKPIGWKGHGPGLGPTKQHAAKLRAKKAGLSPAEMKQVDTHGTTGKGLFERVGPDKSVPAVDLTTKKATKARPQAEAPEEGSLLAAVKKVSGEQNKAKLLKERGVPVSEKQVREITGVNPVGEADLRARVTQDLQRQFDKTLGFGWRKRAKGDELQQFTTDKLVTKFNDKVDDITRRELQKSSKARGGEETTLEHVDASAFTRKELLEIVAAQHPGATAKQIKLKAYKLFDEIGRDTRYLGEWEYAHVTGRPYARTYREMKALEKAQKAGGTRTATKTMPSEPAEGPTAAAKEMADLKLSSSISATSPKSQRQINIEEAAGKKGKGPEAKEALKAKTLKEYKEAVARHERKAAEAQRKGKKMKDVEGEEVSHGIASAMSAKDRQKMQDAATKSLMRQRVKARRQKRRERRGK